MCSTNHLSTICWMNVEWSVICFTIDISNDVIILRYTINNLLDFTLWFNWSCGESWFKNNTKTCLSINFKLNFTSNLWELKFSYWSQFLNTTIFINIYSIFIAQIISDRIAFITTNVTNTRSYNSCRILCIDCNIIDRVINRRSIIFSRRY